MSVKQSAHIDTNYVPPTHQDRRRVWLEALRAVEGVGRERPLDRDALASLSKGVVVSAGVQPQSIGYAMVMVNNAFWLGQFAAIPRERRLLLLPRCLKDIDAVTARAQELGYRYLVADGSPVIVKILNEESMDGVLGLGCLDSLDKAFDKARQVGIPSLAVPLNGNGCKATDVDHDLLTEYLTSEGTDVEVNTRSQLPLLRRAFAVLGRESIHELTDTTPEGLDPTERIAFDWLTTGGKRLRPFLVLAGYDSFVESDDAPAYVRKLALAIEAFHKASLVHDDIEDDDATRYGRPTLNRQYGTAIALNVGDYLVGLGYRVAAAAAAESEHAPAARLIGLLSDAHLQLTRGQGAEFLWARNASDSLELSDVLNWYMLKTAPAFEVALAGGLLLAGALSGREDYVRRFCRQIGTAFQLQNDLDGWEADVEHLRPTALLALALASCTAPERDQLLGTRDAALVREIIMRHGVFDRVREIVERLRERALAVASGCGGKLGELMEFLVNAIVR